MKYSDVVALINDLHGYATDYDPYELGLPNYGDHLEQMVKIVVKHLGVKLDDDPRIQSIMDITGCSREQAIALIDSGCL